MLIFKKSTELSGLVFKKTNFIILKIKIKN